jgi:glucose-1-phosphate thymidylyltransferase
MKGVIMAGGLGTRLRPMTGYMNKHLLPTYDRPMIWNAFELMEVLGADEIALVTSPGDMEMFYKAGLAMRFGQHRRIKYIEQPDPRGIPQGLTLAKDAGFLKPDEPCCLLLGDNLLWSRDYDPEFFCWLKQIKERALKEDLALAVSVPVENPSEYGIAHYDPKTMNIITLVEKPSRGELLKLGAAPPFMAITGFYLFPPGAADIAQGLEPSDRGELEILDLLRTYAEKDKLWLWPLPPYGLWLDMGTPENLHRASQLVRKHKCGLSE